MVASAVVDASFTVAVRCDDRKQVGDLKIRVRTPPAYKVHFLCSY